VIQESPIILGKAHRGGKAIRLGELAMKCPKCGVENAEGEVYCRQCGGRIDGTERVPFSRRFCLNALGLLGALVGVAAIFSVWTRTWALGMTTFNLIDVANEAPTDILAFWAAVVFIVGTLAAFVSSIGWVPQIAGVLLWWWYILDSQGEMPGRPGSYVALASAIIVMISMARPVGPGLMKGPFSLRNRLLVFCPAG